MAQAEDDTIVVPTAPTPIPTALNISELARKFGVDRRTIQRRLKKGWTPPTRRTTRRTKQVEISPQDVPHLVPPLVPQLEPQPMPQLVPQQPQADMPHEVERPGRGLRVLTLMVAIGLAQRRLTMRRST